MPDIDSYSMQCTAGCQLLRRRDSSSTGTGCHLCDYLSHSRPGSTNKAVPPVCSNPWKSWQTSMAFRAEPSVAPSSLYLQVCLGHCCCKTPAQSVRNSPQLSALWLYCLQCLSHLWPCLDGSAEQGCAGQQEGAARSPHYSANELRPADSMFSNTHWNVVCST